MSKPRIPLSRPRATEALVLSKLREAVGDAATTGTRLLVVRSYYDRTISPPGNNLNDYDDAAFIVQDGKLISSWNFNSDPTRYGWNPNAGKYMARLAPGTYRYNRGMHRGRYMAWRQDHEAVKVERIDSSGRVRKTETGFFGIHVHRGGDNSTSSEGCLTLPPSQWAAFDRAMVKACGDDGDFDLTLIDGPIN